MMKKNAVMIVSKRIKDLRKERGITQAQLAEKIDKTVEMISHLENCSAATKLSTLDDIAEALNVELYELFLDDKDYLLKNISSDVLQIIYDLNDKSPEFINSLHNFLNKIK